MYLPVVVYSQIAIGVAISNPAVGGGSGGNAQHDMIGKLVQTTDSVERQDLCYGCSSDIVVVHPIDIHGNMDRSYSITCEERRALRFFKAQLVVRAILILRLQVKIVSVGTENVVSKLVLAHRKASNSNHQNISLSCHGKFTLFGRQPSVDL